MLLQKELLQSLYASAFCWLLRCSAVAPLQKISPLWCNWRQCWSINQSATCHLTVSLLLRNLLLCHSSKQRQVSKAESWDRALLFKSVHSEHCCFFCLSKSELARDLVCWHDTRKVWNLVKLTNTFQIKDACVGFWNLIEGDNYPFA